MMNFDDVTKKTIKKTLLKLARIFFITHIEYQQFGVLDRKKQAYHLI